MKTYVTFGQSHRHEINGKVFDKDCVAVIESDSALAGRGKAFELFGQKFCFEYPEDRFDPGIMRYFPRGFTHVETTPPTPIKMNQSRLLKIIIELTELEAENLEDVLAGHQDEGPVTEGWRSRELKTISQKISEAIARAKANS